MAKPQPFSISKWFAGLRADWSMVKPSRFMRRQTGLAPLGGSGDYHFRNENEYYQSIEQARDLMRNDPVIGQAVDRAVLNIVQSGLMPDPDTGDDQLNSALWDRWMAWADDPQSCDIQGVLTFGQMQTAVMRAVFSDGDIFALATTDGQLQLVESHLCVSPGGKNHNIVLGVELGVNRQRLAYWFTGDTLDPYTISQTSPQRCPAYDENAQRLVFHVYVPKRVTQTRGVTAIAPAFELAQMLGDINFAKLVQQQVVSCITFFRERDVNAAPIMPAPVGETQITTRADGSVENRQELSPGLEIIGAPGERLASNSPNVPNPEYFEQVKMVLTLIGVNIGLPYVMVLMDASDTNFSGWRGAVDQARMGFEAAQHTLRQQLCVPAYQWQLRRWLAEESALRNVAASIGKRFFQCKWNRPQWRYIQPEQDARADVLRRGNLLTSPRRLMSERGMDVDIVQDETVADNARLIEIAIAKAAEIEARTGQPINPARIIDPFGQGELSVGKMDIVETYGRAVRSGLLTPQEDDEEHIRSVLELPPMTKATRRRWQSEPKRIPVTLKEEGNDEATVTTGSAANSQATGAVSATPTDAEGEADEI